jgi:NitT/TauT family transport system ATP-binding protein
MIALDVKNIKKKFNATFVLDDVSFQLSDCQVVAILGPNGCGKSTLLKIIANLEDVDSGLVVFGDKIDNKKVGMVFQNYHDALFPWKTVEENIVFAIKAGNKNKNDYKKILRRFNLEAHRNKYPYQLSGGLSQLTNLARIYATDPDILLLDEPFSSLDYNSSLKLLQQFSDIWSKTKLPTLLVTHSIEEAVFLADKIIIFSNPPTRVVKIIENNLSHPRSIDQIKTNEFHDLRKNILENIEGFLV